MENKRTCLYDEHLKLKALISPFAGYDMPIQYTDIVAEHNAVREHCGVFDVSHMGEIEVKGPQAEEFVNYIFTNDVRLAPAGKCFYGMMLNPDGGVVDDLLVYKKADDDYFLVVNASNISKDYAWILKNATHFEVKTENLSEKYGELAIQGPESEAVIEDVLKIPASDLAFYSFKEIEYEGEKIIVSRTGYTGEDGFEVYASPELTVKLWQTLMASGKSTPCGLGCRDTLRFEVGLPLYGDELTDDITPLEAGLGIFVKFDKDDFIGKEPLARQKEAGVSRKIVGLELLERAIPRHGYEVLNANDETVGSITTGYHSISTGKDIAMALVDAEYAKIGTPLKVKIRKKTFPAVVTSKKFFKKSYKN